MSGDIAVPAWETYVEDDLREALAEIRAASDEEPGSGAGDVVIANTGEGGAKKRRTHRKKASAPNSNATKGGKEGKERKVEPKPKRPANAVR